MSAPPLDEFLARHAPGPVLEPDPALLDARASLASSLDQLGSVDDAALERPWPWRAEEVDVRYGLYRQYEALEEAAVAVGPLIAGARVAEPPARPMLGAATAARWDLHGLLAGLPDELLDRDPGDEQWTIRQTLAHIVSGQRGYGWGSAWWLSRRDAAPDDYPRYFPQDVASQLPAEELEGEGSLAEIRARLDLVLDQTAGVFAGLDDEALAVRARWAGIAVDLRFRLHRWSSHIREHTVQVEKTLVALGRAPSEVERVLRLVAAAYGRLEEQLYMWPADSRPASEACALAARTVAAVAADAASVVEAADRRI